jgi:glutamyl-Q tRNA(Asp) synthetase
MPPSAESAAGDFQPIYIGRFAPSPTGPLHLGSLVAALGSFLDARRAGGRWLLRIEDLDTARVIPGCSDEMLRTLEAFGLYWDGAVEYQSRRIPQYVQSLETLRAAGLTFQCSCSRRELGHRESPAEASEGTPGGGYPGTCRSGPTRSCGATTTRFRIDDGVVSFLDRIQGWCQFNLPTLGDPVIVRRDGAFAYQLAVVVDDASQGVSDIVRGADLLQSTPWQIRLQQALRLPTPHYAHLPLVVEPTGGKLSKSRRALAIEPARAASQLFEALNLLQQHPPAQLECAPPATLLAWAITHWNLDTVHACKKIVVSTQIAQV